MTRIRTDTAGKMPLGGAVTLLPRVNRWSPLSSNTRTNTTVTLQTVFFWPFRLQRQRTLSAIGIEVTAGVANAIARVGIYNDAVDFNDPGTGLLLPAGTIDCSAVGDPVATGGIATTAITGLAQVLPAGTYWCAVVNQTAQATFRLATGMEPVSTSTPNGSAPESLRVQTGVAAGLPDPSVPSGDINVGILPWLKWSA